MYKNRVVIVECEVRCEWQDMAPRYRAYVNNELFTERTWIWDDVMLEECFQIKAQPGKYLISYEIVDPAFGKLQVSNWRVVLGSAHVNQQGEVEIQ